MLHKLENVKFERKIIKPSLQPMDFICTDLIGEIHPPTSHEHRYALTAVCMLTGFTWCVPLKTKTAEEVSKAYLDHIYSNFGGSKDMEELDARSINNITGLFATLQMCHENSTKMAGHLVQLGSTLTPKQYTYIMKHSLHPLVQISIPSRLCSPTDLKFSKLCLTPQETKEEIDINQCLPKPFHPALAVLPPKHPARCLAAIIHTVLRRELFNTKESTSTISEQFQVAPKKLYEGLTGKRYYPGQKLTKVEKAAREAAKVTPSTKSATPSTPSTSSTTALSTIQEEPQPTATTEVDPEMPPLEVIRPRKKFRFKDPESKHFPK